MKNLVKALTIVFALMFLRGMASGNLVDAHMMVNKYSFPDLVFGNGPTQSIIILLKGSWTAGMGCSGGFWYSLIRFPNNLAGMTRFAKFHYIFSQTGPVKMVKNLVMPMWPARGVSCAILRISCL